MITTSTITNPGINLPIYHEILRNLSTPVHFGKDSMKMAVEQQNGSHPTPLKKTGVIDEFEHEDTTPVIGREFPKVNIVDDILNASNADELIRDLAITSTSVPRPKLRPGTIPYLPCTQFLSEA